MRKRLLVPLIPVFLVLPAFADSWTLGVMEFSFRQAMQSRPQSFEQAARVLPQLIVEQFSNDEIRTIPAAETLSRKLRELQTARLSLFLQLSKEYKARDSLLLSSSGPKALRKSIKAETEKIRDIEAQIDKNLEDARRLRAEAQPKIERERLISEGKKDGDSGKDGGFFPFQLPFSFFSRDEDDEIVSERVALYKGDSTALFTPGEKAVQGGFSSWDFEQDVAAAKINGLISGEITVYGDYCSVTATLRMYPGAQILGTVTEVGVFSDLMPLANSVARSLDPKIANALPVLMEFEIEPKEIAADAKITIDGLVFPLRKNDGSFDNKIIDESGVHRLSIEAPGYERLSFTYAFTEENRFIVRAGLVPEIRASARIRLKKYQDGIFQIYGLSGSPVSAEEPRAMLEVNSKPVLGVFTVPKAGPDDSDSSNIAFFRIPSENVFDGANLIVNAKPFDRAANIDKRRRWMYTAYTALICSLPFTFYNLGEFTAENTAYIQGRGDYGRLKKLQHRSNICVGITAVCGVWAGIELIRYLWSADRVLPARAGIDKNAAKESASPLSGEKNEDPDLGKIIETDDAEIQ